MELGEYDDGPITYVEDVKEDHGKKIVDQLKDYLNNTPKEQLERDFFEIECKCEGIDPNDKNAERKLWWKHAKHKLRIASHYIGHWTLKVLIIVSAWLGGVFYTTAATNNVDFMIFFVCIVFAYALLAALIEHNDDWFFLRNRN